MKSTDTSIKHIIIDENLRDNIIVKKALEYFPEVSFSYLTSSQIYKILKLELKSNRDIFNAKQTLVLMNNRGSFFKELRCHPSIFDPERNHRIRLEFMQGCPADCHYCFCQTYLQPYHPILFCNFDDITKQNMLQRLDDKIIVTGDVSDSLALGDFSVFLHKYLMRLLPLSNFELRTKFLLPEKFLKLDRDRIRLDYTLSPNEAIKRKEPGTADLDKRLKSIQKALSGGFHVSIRFDPIQPVNAGIRDYYPLLENLKEIFREREPVSFILGSYKLSRPLKENIRRRFPGSDIPSIEWTEGIDGKSRPFRSIRFKAYRHVIDCIRLFFREVPIFLSMEYKWMWSVLDLSIY